MTAQYDIFKKTPNNDFIWLEEVDRDARKRLIHLTSTEPAEYRLWDSARQMFVEPLDGARSFAPVSIGNFSWWFALGCTQL